MLTTHALLAQSKLAERLRELRGGFERTSEASDVKNVFLVIAIPIGLVLLLVLIRQMRVRRRAGANSPARPSRLFDIVLRKMNVKLADRFLLRAFARSAKIAHPTALFFSRDLFERQTAKWVATISTKSLHRHAKARFAAIADMAFGSPAI